MGFPASNIEGVYRNHIDDVAKLFDLKHKDHYKIYNLCSERSYDTRKFHNRVEVFPFDDHNPPKIELIKPFCESVHEWLSQDDRNVAVVHCKAGKGRTGTMICCYLLHSRQFTNADDALNFYGQVRTQDRKGVTIPSQLRYVRYYAKIVHENLIYQPVSLYIHEMILEPLPNITSGQGSICFSISTTDTCNKNQKLYKSNVYEIKRGAPNLVIGLDCCTPLVGDVKIELYTKAKIRKEKLVQFWFNTFFVCDERECDTNGFSENRNGDNKVLVLTLSKEHLDIVNKKDKQHKMFSSDFRVSFFLLLFYPPPSCVQIGLS